MLHHHPQDLLEVDSGLAEVILATEGVAWDQEKMGMEALEGGVVREGVAALVKDSFPLENGEEEKDCLKDLDPEEVVDMAEAGLVGLEVDIKAFEVNDTIPKATISLLGASWFDLKSSCTPMANKVTADVQIGMEGPAPHSHVNSSRKAQSLR